MKIFGILLMIAGAALAVAGVALGLYCGLWWAFVGGIVDILDAFKAPGLVSMDVAIGVVKIIAARVTALGVGGVSISVGVIVMAYGAEMMDHDWSPLAEMREFSRKHGGK